MEDKAYFCPNCTGNRTKFKVIHREAQNVIKDAFDGHVINMGDNEPYVDEQGDTEVQCQACNYVGYEMMFIKAAERNPRQRTEVQGRM